jgi:ATP/maltotriose-dependent transcriptional regulator MalT
LLRAGGEQNATSLATALLTASWVLGSIGQFEAAREAEAQGAAIAQRTGDLNLQSLAAWARARNDVATGEYGIARASLEHALRAELSPFDEAILRLALAVTYPYLESREVALEALKDALLRARRYRSVQVQVLAMSALADALIGFGQIEEAGPLLDEAYATANRIGARLHLADIRHLQGRASLATGDLAGAEASLLEALSAFEEAGAPLKVAWAAVDLFRLHDAKCDRANAVCFLEKAHTIFRDAGVPNHVRIVENLAAGASIRLRT